MKKISTFFVALMMIACFGTATIESSAAEANYAVESVIVTDDVSASEVVLDDDVTITKANNNSNTTQTNKKDDKKEKSFGAALVRGLIIGFVITLIVMFALYGQMKSVAKKTEARDYVVPGSLRLSTSRDSFLYQKTTKTERQTNK